jgi:hypothetical protein
MRLPAAIAFQESARLTAAARSEGPVLHALGDFAAGLPWALARRRVIPPSVLAAWRQAFREPATGNVPEAAPDTAPQAGDARP